MQSFITPGKWEAGEAMQKVQAAFAEELVPSCSRWSIGTVSVLDESGFERSGSESVGVARQCCGRLGKVENCQVGVYLVGVTPDGTCPLDQQLFLPKEWIKDKTRRRNTQVPRDITFQSMPEIAAEMIRRTREAGHVKFDWITGDSLYSDSGPLRAALEASGQGHVLAVRGNLTVWIVDPGNRTSVTLGTKGRKKHGTWRHPDCRSLESLAKEFTTVDRLKRGESYGLPYGMLVPKGWQNLWVAGRCNSSDIEVHGAIRDQPACYMMGQAAGTAAVRSLRTGQPANDLDTEQLVKSLREAGAILPQKSLSKKMTRS